MLCKIHSGEGRSMKNLNNLRDRNLQYCKIKTFALGLGIFLIFFGAVTYSYVLNFVTTL